MLDRLSLAVQNHQTRAIARLDRIICNKLLGIIKNEVRQLHAYTARSFVGMVICAGGTRSAAHLIG